MFTDWDAVETTGDDVAVPALGQSNFLLFVFGLFFILSSIVLLVVLDLSFLWFLVYDCVLFFLKEKRVIGVFVWWLLWISVFY
jgi:hypothetical protein